MSGSFDSYMKMIFFCSLLFKASKIGRLPPSMAAILRTMRLDTNA